MKREFITSLLPDIDKGILDQIMAEHGKDIEAQKNTIFGLETERDGLKEQLEAANVEIKSYKDMDIDGIKEKAGEWETKYNDETQALKQQLEDARYGFAVKEAVSGLKFTSESARKAFVADLTAKKLPAQDGKLLGLDDFTKSYKETDPGAFEPEGNEPPRVVSKTSGVGGGNGGLSAMRAAMGLPAEKE